MHTKGRYFEVLESNNFIDTKKNDFNHKNGSMDVWKSELATWSKTGSKLPRWHLPQSATFYDLDLTPPPVQAFGLNASVPQWFHRFPFFSYAISTFFPSLPDIFL